MPTYSYECPICTNEFDRILPMSEYKTTQACDRCGCKTTKVMCIGTVRREKPVWLDNSVRNQLYDTDSPHIPIETRTDYNNFLKDNGIVPTN